MKKIFSLILIMYSSIGFCQSDKHIIYERDNVFKFNKDGTFNRVPLYGNFNSWSTKNPSVISESNGNLLILSDGHQIYKYDNGELKTIASISDSLIPATRSNNILRVSDNQYHAIHGWVQPNRFHRRTKLEQTKSGLFVNQLTSTQSGILLDYKNKKIADGANANRILAISRIRLYEYLMLLTSSENPTVCYIASYDIDGLKIRDTISFMASDFLKEEIPELEEERNDNFNIPDAKFSFNVDRLFISRQAFVTTYKLGTVYSYSSIEEFKLDKDFKLKDQSRIIIENFNIHPVISKKPIIKEFFYNPYNIPTQFSEGQLVVSPNDSFLYFFKQTIPCDTNEAYSNYKYEVISTNFKQDSVLDAVVSMNYVRFGKHNLYIRGIDFSPYGRLMVNHEKPKSAKHSLSSFTYTNSPKTGNTFIHDFHFLVGMSHPTNTSIHIYDFARISFDIQYDCHANVKTKNESDSSNHLNRFMWIVQNEPGDLDTIFEKEPQFTFNKNGNYPFKILAYSTQNNYAEWYLDTFHITDIPILSPEFTTPDSVVCKFSPVIFMNSSYSQNVHPNALSEWTWNFGDNAESTQKAPTHIYSDPGVYDITLSYQIAKCDTTVIKKRFIKVIDSPNPGFAVEKNSGCAPFEAKFSDTNSLNVAYKEYYFSDISSWETPSKNYFSHMFLNPGKHFVVQRLHGESGCVTQLDSIWVDVRPKINMTQDIQVASYIDNEHIQLTWHGQQSAQYFQILKKGPNSDYKLLASTAFMTYIDTIHQPAPFSYQVLAIDSCGNSSIRGLSAFPMLLTGSKDENDRASVIRFSPYKNWHDSIINYSVLVKHNGIWIEESNQLDTIFTDNNFLIENQKQKCYRILAQNHAYSCYSNSLCLPYAPKIFIPTAFSPNNDGINDELSILTYGIRTYEIEVFNRWGGLIKKLTTGQNWNGESHSAGVYLLKIMYRDNLGIRHFSSETVNLVR